MPAMLVYFISVKCSFKKSSASKSIINCGTVLMIGETTLIFACLYALAVSIPVLVDTRLTTYTSSILTVLIFKFAKGKKIAANKTEKNETLVAYATEC